MKIFIAGGSGVIGRQLIAMLIAEGHRVVAMTRSAEGAARLEPLGAEVVKGDVFAYEHLTDLLNATRPEVVMHQLTAFSARQGDPLAATIRVRTEGTRNLVAAAQNAGVRRFIAQSISFVCMPVPDGLTDEATPLYLSAGPAIRPLVESIAELETRTLNSGMENVILRYGWFYGAGTNYDPAGTIARALKKNRLPMVGAGKGCYSFISVRDAAAATFKALASKEQGIFNIVDDDPAPFSEWLPYAAELLGAPKPPFMAEAQARAKLGDLFVYMYNEQSGASNQKAKQLLGWQPGVSSWRTGFRDLYSSPVP